MPAAVQAIFHQKSPTVVRGAAAGSTSTVTISGSDTVGIVTVVTAGADETAGGIVATVTFGKAFKAAPKVVVVAQANNPAAATAVAPLVDSIATTGFAIVTKATLTDAKTYILAYVIVPEDGEV